MKVAIIIVVLLLSGCTHKIMNNAMGSWKGAHIDEVIQQWGYPTGEQTIAGHHLYVWEQTNGMDISGGGWWPGARKWSRGGSAEVKFCNRILEADDKGIITRWQWNGNDCLKLHDDWERQATAKKQ